MSETGLYHVPLALDTLMKEGKMGIERKDLSFLVEGKEWRLPGLYADGLVLCDESEEDL